MKKWSILCIIILFLFSLSSCTQPSVVEAINYYYGILHINLAPKIPDRFLDTHSGFHGDGKALVIITLTEEENNKLGAEISNSELWEKISYGKEHRVQANARLQFIPEWDDGYYCIYDKDEKRALFLISENYNSSFIYCQYSYEKRQIYIYERTT